VELRELSEKRLGEKQKLRLASVEFDGPIKACLGSGWVGDVSVPEVFDYGGKLVLSGELPGAAADRMVESVDFGCENGGGGLGFRKRFQKSR
jgi:hypothetical protein